MLLKKVTAVKKEILLTCDYFHMTKYECYYVNDIVIN